MNTPIHGPDVKLYNPAYVHPSALIFGDVTIRDGASVWPNVVMRAEMPSAPGFGFSGIGSLQANS